MLRRGVFSLAEPYAKKPLHPFLAANYLKKGSYVSLQSALSYYHMIPEYVPVTTSVTTGRPEKVSTALGLFSYHHVTSSMFFGYTKREIVTGQDVTIACPEKALLDLLYFTPESHTSFYLKELRLSWSNDFSWTIFSEFLERIKSPKLSKSETYLKRLFDEQKGYQNL